MKTVNRRQALAGLAGVLSTATVAKAIPCALKELPADTKPAHLTRIIFRTTGVYSVTMTNHVAIVSDQEFVPDVTTGYVKREQRAWIDEKDAVVGTDSHDIIWGEVVLVETKNLESHRSDFQVREVAETHQLPRRYIYQA